jgi:hypothetical protein
MLFPLLAQHMQSFTKSILVPELGPMQVSVADLVRVLHAADKDRLQFPSESQASVRSVMFVPDRIHRPHVYS